MGSRRGRSPIPTLLFGPMVRLRRPGKGGETVKQIRVQKKPAKVRRGERCPVLPLDPRDPDVVRAKRATSGSSFTRLET